MKRTPKLNTVEIADKLNELAADAAMIALAAEGLRSARAASALIDVSFGPTGTAALLPSYSVAGG